MQNATVLIVDDEHLIRWSMRQHLEKDGYSALEASTVREARVHLFDAKKKAPDAVLLDQRLPDGDGQQLLKEIKKANPSLPVIMVTAHCSIDQAVSAMRAGAFFYTGKPVNLDELMEIVKMALAARSSRANDPEPLPGQPDTGHEIAGIRIPADGLKIGDVEKELIKQALVLAKGNRTRAAKLVGMTRDQVRYRIEKFGLLEFMKHHGYDELDD